MVYINSQMRYFCVVVDYLSHCAITIFMLRPSQRALLCPVRMGYHSGIVLWQSVLAKDKHPIPSNFPAYVRKVVSAVTITSFPCFRTAALDCMSSRWFLHVHSFPNTLSASETKLVANNPGSHAANSTHRG